MRSSVTSSSAPRGRSAAPHQDRFGASLQKGDNDILVKVENLGASWALYLAIQDPQRELQFRAD